MTLLAVYFIFILDHRNDVRQKVNSSNFFFKFKIGLKTEETACNINSKLTQELLMNVQGSGDSRTRGLKMRNTGAGHWKLTTTNWETSLKLMLKTTWKVAREVNINHSIAIWHLKQTGKVKKLNKWVPQELTTNQRNHCFEVSFSLILPYNNKPFLDQIVMCNEKWILYDNHWWLAQCLDQEEAPKYFQMPNLHQKNLLVTLW